MITSPQLLRKGDIELREITPEDTEFVVQLRNHPDIRKWFYTREAITATSHQKFLEDYFSPQNKDEIYIIEYQGQATGMISVYNISGKDARWGRIAIKSEKQGQGIGKVALELLIERAKVLKLRRLYCSPLKSNLKAVSMYKKVGFQEYGEDEISVDLELLLTA